VARLRKVSGREAVAALQRLGFTKVRQRGSHVVMRRDTADGTVGCVVPLHRELKIGTLRGILRLATVSLDEFMDALRETCSGPLSDKGEHAAARHEC